MKAWIVYWDFVDGKIKGIFTSLEKAQALKDKLVGEFLKLKSYCIIEEFLLDRECDCPVIC